MAPPNRKKYCEEFKRKVVGLTRQPGSCVAQIAWDIGVNTNSLYRCWVELDAHGKKPFPGAGVARDQEVLALKRELAKVKKELDFLRDAAALFARESS